MMNDQLFHNPHSLPRRRCWICGSSSWFRCCGFHSFTSLYPNPARAGRVTDSVQLWKPVIVEKNRRRRLSVVTHESGVGNEPGRTHAHTHTNVHKHARTHAHRMVQSDLSTVFRNMSDNGPRCGHGGVKCPAAAQVCFCRAASLAADWCVCARARAHVGLDDVLTCGKTKVKQVNVVFPFASSRD